MNEGNLTKKEKRALAKERKRKERGKEERKKRTLSIFVGIIIVAGLMFLGVKLFKWLNAPTQAPQEIVNVDDNDWIKGNPFGSVVLVEYADFECPACSSFAQQTKQLVEDYPENVRVVYRHFPLESIHKNAQSAAKAAEAAGMQGKFWEMHDLLYEKQSDWKDEGNIKEKFVSYALDLALDEEKFVEDFESSEVEKRIENDLSSALSLGLNSTPSLFINGEKTNIPPSYDKFKSLVESKIVQ